jgi:two-component system, LytTR family, sensor kinase
LDFKYLFRRLAFWATLIITILFVLLRETRHDYIDPLHRLADLLVLMTYSGLIWGISFWLDRRKLVFKKFSSGNQRYEQIWKTSISVFVGLALAVVIEMLVYSTINEETGPLFYFVIRGLLITAIIQVLFYSISSVYQSRQVEVENLRLREENVQAQLDVFRQQVNPHFLFNALNTLRSFVQLKHPETGNFVVQLSEVYRYLLQNSQENKVTLEQELSMLKAYSYLLRARFQDNFNLHLNIPAVFYPSIMPPLTLQLLVENAVKHNIVSSENPLHIWIEIQAEKQVLEVRNNRQAKRSTSASTGIGLPNIDQRYKLLCGRGINIVQSDLFFSVSLPIIPSGNEPLIERKKEKHEDSDR